MSAIIGSTPSPQGESNGYAVVCHGNRKLKMCGCREPVPGVDLGGGCRGCAPPSPQDDLRFSNTTGILQKKKKKTMWFIGVEVEQETSAPPPKKILDPPLRLL